MTPDNPFEANLEAIERAIARVCREARLAHADAEDFASSARIALLADDCSILRRFEGRSSLATYVTVVVRRLLVDARRAEGRWYASAEAQRRGDAAVLLERLTRRDGRSLGDAIAAVRAVHPEISARELEQIAAALPERAVRAVIVALAEGDEERFAGIGAANDRVDALDTARRSKQMSEAALAAMASMAPQDRAILRLRFRAGASIADIARALGLEQRPLYRRMEALLASLRRAFETAGFDAGSVADLIGAPEGLLDFDLDGKRSGAHPSLTEEGR